MSRRRAPHCPPLGGRPADVIKAFIRIARSSGRVVPPERFDDSEWDLTDCSERKPGVPTIAGRRTLHFRRRIRSGPRSGEDNPFAPILRAIVTQEPWAGVSSRRRTVLAGLLIGESMAAMGVGRVELCTAAVFAGAARAAKEGYDGETAYSLAQHVDRIAAFLAGAGMLEKPLPAPPAGRPATPRLPDRSSPAFAERSARILPGDEVLAAIQEAYSRAVRPADVIVTRIVALLASTPSRINEVLRLDECPEREGLDEAGASQPMLCWPGSKGSDDGVRLIPACVQPLVADALWSLHKVTEEGRNMKRWYDVNPDVLYLPKHLRHLRGRARLSFADLSALLGTGTRNMAQTIQPAGAGRSISFASFEAWILSRLPDRMRDAGGPGAHPLLVVPERTFVTLARRSACMFEHVSHQSVFHRLNAGHAGVFASVGLDQVDGLKVLTKAFRHWLNTEAFRNGLSQSDVAVWSGRANHRHNASYDHRTASEVRAAAAAANPHSGRTTSPLSRRPGDGGA